MCSCFLGVFAYSNARYGSHQFLTLDVPDLCG
jgi:hypothetical protein